MIRCVTVLGMFAVLTVAPAAAQQGTDGPGASPALGTWSFTGNSKAGKGFEAPLVFIRRSGARTEGFLDFAPNGPLKAVEIVSCTFDAATRLVRITGREMHATAPGMSPGIYEAKLSEDGKTLSNFRNLR